MVEGRASPHGGVTLDLTRNDPDVLERLAAPFMKKLEPFGIDIRRQPIEIAPAVHYFMGGVEINALAETALPGLYAAGEVTGGVQGSNRLSSNSLTDVAVFGAIAGREAAKYAKARKHHAAWLPLERAARATLRSVLNDGAAPAGDRLAAIHTNLKRVMFAAGGLVRDASAMKQGLRELDALCDQFGNIRRIRSADLRQFAEVQNMLVTGEAVVRSALLRTESRGAHYRSDYSSANEKSWRAVTRVFGTVSTSGALHAVKRSMP